ncbi:MAG TPA: ROK family glucokinase [Sedimentisphaerales bacterium]|nr:ROK family glucokinase [Sedimentisphaerales bacterium]
MGHIYIGIDLGGTNIKFGVFDKDLNIISKSSIDANVDTGAEIMINRIGDYIEKIVVDNKYSMKDVKAIGMGSTGQFNLTEGIMYSCPNMPLFKNVPMKKMLSNRTSKPCVIENDANTACYGEYACGAGQGSDNMVFFTLGTGVGGGIIYNGHLVHGTDDSGGELGHIIIHPGGRLCGCGQRGCIEAYASASSTARRATEAVIACEPSSLKKLLDENGRITCKDVFVHAEKGDKLASKIADETARDLAIGCITMRHVTEPHKFVFAGGMIAAGQPLLNAIKKHFADMIWSMKKEDVEICFAQLGENAGIVGAAALARDIK